MFATRHKEAPWAQQTFALIYDFLWPVDSLLWRPMLHVRPNMVSMPKGALTLARLLFPQWHASLREDFVHEREECVTKREVCGGACHVVDRILKCSKFVARNATH